MKSRTTISRDKMYGKLNNDLFQEVATFLLGTRKYQKEKNAALKIQRWWNNKKTIEWTDSWDKQIHIRMISLEYSNEQLFEFPELVVNKMRLYTFKNINLPENKPTKRSEVLKWVRINMNNSDLALIGF